MKLTLAALLFICSTAMLVRADSPVAKVSVDRKLTRTIEICNSIRIDVPKTWCVVAPGFSYTQTNWLELDPIARENWNPKSLHNSASLKSLLRLERYSDLKKNGLGYSEISIIKVDGESAIKAASTMHAMLASETKLDMLLSSGVVARRINGKIFHMFRVSTGGVHEQYAYADSELGIILIQAAEYSRSSTLSADAERLVGRIYVDPH